jgi:hypothetical protein
MHLQQTRLARSDIAHFSKGDADLLVGQHEASAMAQHFGVDWVGDINGKRIISYFEPMIVFGSNFADP